MKYTTQKDEIKVYDGSNDLLAPERKGRAWQVGCCISGVVVARPVRQ